MPAVQGPQAQSGGLTAGWLKTIAVAAMVVDHTAWTFVPLASWQGVAMHFFGRTAGPVMFFLVGEGYHHTRSKDRYTLRLGVFALVSWPFYYFYKSGALPGPGGFTPFGVGYTLFLGLLCIRAQRELKGDFARPACILLLILASAFGDWAIIGAAIVLLFDYFRESRTMQLLVVGAVFGGTILLDVFGLAAGGVPLGLAGYATPLFELGMFLPLVLLRFYNGRRGAGGPLAKWAFYAIYPLHLGVLGFLRYGLPW